MAYVSQEMKKAKASKIKEIAKKYNIKASLSVHHHSELCLKISEGAIDFIKNAMKTHEENGFLRENYITEKTTYISVNHYHFKNHFSGKAKECLEELISVMQEGNYDNSDIMTDYFDVGYYISVTIGTWDKPYKLVA